MGMVCLGVGLAATDPHKESSVIYSPVTDRHYLTEERTEGGDMYYSGVRVFTMDLGKRVCSSSSI